MVQLRCHSSLRPLKAHVAQPESPSVARLCIYWFVHVHYTGLNVDWADHYRTCLAHGCMSSLTADQCSWPLLFFSLLHPTHDLTHSAPLMPLVRPSSMPLYLQVVVRRDMLLGQGAAGLVYRGVYEGREVAVKLLRSGPTGGHGVKCRSQALM